MDEEWDIHPPASHWTEGMEMMGGQDEVEVGEDHCLVLGESVLGLDKKLSY